MSRTAGTPLASRSPLAPESATLALALEHLELPVDPLRCTRCGTTMRIIALIGDSGVIARILRHLSRWDPQPETRSPAGPDPPWPNGETIPLTCHPVPDIA